MTWLIFDADNTLWDVEALYNDARAQFCDYVLAEINKANYNKDASISVQIIDVIQRQRDMVLYQTHGYSSSRFARSFEDTLVFLYPYATPAMIIHARSLALRVFDQKAVPMKDLDQVIQTLCKTYSLGIITAGERWVQEKRLQDFHLRASFKEVLVVERKTAQVFTDFCKRRDIGAHEAIVIGDSVRSDIIPAREAGIRAIHVHSPNWAAEQETIPTEVQSVNNLSDLLEVIPRLIS